MPAAAPPLFKPAALAFLKQLRAHNDRAWFQPRKAEFEELLRRPMLAVAAAVSDQMRAFAIDHVRPAGRAVHRIYRDVRFSKSKLPYKTHVSALWPRPGLSKWGGAVYYLSVSPDGVEIAAGSYGPEPAELTVLRRHIDADPAAFARLTTAPSLLKLMGPLRGEQLVRVPKPFSADGPAADAIRRKQFYFGVTLDPETATRPTLLRAIVDRYRAVAPFVDHVNAVLLAADRREGEDDGRPKRPSPMF